MLLDIRAENPQPYIVRGPDAEQISIPVPFMLLSERSRRPLSTCDVVPFHIPQQIQEKTGLQALSISFLTQRFPTFYSYEKPVSPVAYMTLRTHTTQLAVPWGQYFNTDTQQYYMSVSALPTFLKQDSDGNQWVWHRSSGLCFNPSRTSLIGQGWELIFTGNNEI